MDIYDYIEQVPIAKREAWARSEFGRKETIAHSEILLNELHSKTHALLSALLPPHVVTLLSTQQRHERRAIAEYYSDVSIIFTGNSVVIFLQNSRLYMYSSVGVKLMNLFLLALPKLPICFDIVDQI